MLQVENREHSSLVTVTSESEQGINKSLLLH